jgi:IS30 family transposase
MTHPANNSTPIGASLLSEQQDRYFLLMRRGMNNVQACRAVGISRKTGTRWRLGRTEHKNGHRRTYAPVGTSAIPPISSRYLSEPERVRIADLRRLGWTIRAIADDLGRAPSTVSRELNRNSDRADGPGYLPHHAHRRAAARRARPKPTKLALDAELREFVAARLAKKWSPEQPWRHLAIETLYRAVYRPGHIGLQKNSTEALRTGRPRRRPQHHPHRRKARICEPSNMIDQRPAEVDDRAVPGHWEGDLIIGRNGGSAIATLVERTTRFLLLVHLPGSRTAATLRKAIVPALQAIPAHLRRSITWDQGGEMALHGEITTVTGTPVYFCHPHSPWERGSNENMNGVLRQYFPKSTDLAIHTPERLTEVANEINERPRKTLSWATPAEILATLSSTTN